MAGLKMEGILKLEGSKVRGITVSCFLPDLLPSERNYEAWRSSCSVRNTSPPSACDISD